MIRTIAFLASAAALAAGAADINIEGRWLVNGVPQPQFDGMCDLNLYAAESGGTALATAGGVPFVTDPNAYFVVSASVTAPQPLPDTYWVGVKPSGGGEIVPRFRVAPVPFALAADSAGIVRCDGEFTLTGEATVERLQVSGDATVGEWTIPPDSTVTAKNLQIGSVRLEKLTLCDAGLLGFFNDNTTAPSYDYDFFVAEKSVSATANVYTEWEWLICYLYVKPQSATDRWTFDSDGFLMIAIKGEPRKCPAPHITVKVGQTTMLNDLKLGTDGSSDNEAASVRRFMTVPYRAGETVEVTVRTVGYDGSVNSGWSFSESPWKSFAGAKARLVRFGRK